MSKIIKQDEVLTLKGEANIAKSAVFGANEPLELVESVKTLVKIKQAVKQAKDKLKEIKSEADPYIKEMEEAFNSLEADVKEKFLETYKEVEVIRPARKFNPDSGKWEFIANDETGEVLNKVKKMTNKGQKVFTYTEPKTEVVVDEEALKASPIKYTDFLTQKITYTVDQKAIQLHIERNGGFGELPTKTVSTEARAGIQWKQVETLMKAIEEK